MQPRPSIILITVIEWCCSRGASTPTIRSISNRCRSHHRRHSTHARSRAAVLVAPHASPAISPANFSVICFCFGIIDRRKDDFAAPNLIMFDGVVLTQRIALELATRSQCAGAHCLRRAPGLHARPWEVRIFSKRGAFDLMCARFDTIAHLRHLHFLTKVSRMLRVR